MVVIRFLFLVLPYSLSKTNSEDSKASFDDPDRETFALANKFLRRVSMNQFPQPRQRLSSNDYGVPLSHLCEFQDFLGRSAPSSIDGGQPKAGGFDRNG